MSRKRVLKNKIVATEPTSDVQKYEKNKIYFELGRKVSITLSTYLNGSFAAVVTFFMFFKPLLQQLRFIPILPLVGETANFLFHMRKLILAPLSVMPLHTKFSIGSLVITSYLAATLAMTAGVLHGFGISLLAHVLPFNPLLFTISLGIHAGLSSFKFAKTLINYVRFPEQRTQLKTLRVVSQGVKATGMITLTSVMIPLMMATGAAFIVGGLSNPFTAGPVAIALFSVFATTCAVLVARKIIKTYIKHRLQEKAVQKYLETVGTDQAPEEIAAKDNVSSSLKQLTKEILDKPRSKLLLKLARDIYTGKAKNPESILKVSRIGRLPGLLYINFIVAKMRAKSRQEERQIINAYNTLNSRFLRNISKKSLQPSLSSRDEDQQEASVIIDDSVVIQGSGDSTPRRPSFSNTEEQQLQQPVSRIQDSGNSAPITSPSTQAKLLEAFTFNRNQQSRISAISLTPQQPASLPSSSSLGNSLSGSNNENPTIKQKHKSVDNFSSSNLSQRRNSLPSSSSSIAPTSLLNSSPVVCRSRNSSLHKDTRKSKGDRKNCGYEETLETVENSSSFTRLGVVSAGE